MKAQNLAISIPKTKECDKQCPYCISRMTGYLKPDHTLFFRNLKKVKTLAKHSQITSVLITGKGEPTLEWDLLMSILDEFNEFPVELQTNGKELNKHLEKIMTLATHGLNVLAISIDHPDEMLKNYDLVKKAQDNGILVRYTINLTDRFNKFNFDLLFHECTKISIDQFSLREVTIPMDAVDTAVSKSAQKWIEKNVDPNFVLTMYEQMNETLGENGRFLMSLPYGANLYDYKGISVTWFDYCVQDSNEGNDIRSLIYQEDGHLSMCWNSRASRLF